MQKRLQAIVQISLYFLLFIPALLFYKHGHYWLISERGDDARDNGYWMFFYLRKHHPEINTVYVIEQGATDRDKLLPIGPVVQKGSLKHWFIFIAADVRMSTHLFLFAPGSYAGQWIKKHGSSSSINVDLNHGVNHNHYPSLYKTINGSGLMVVGAKPEYDAFINRYGWDKRSLKYTGLARFDGLHDFITRNQILVMPTWRTELRDVDENTFIQSVYFLSWNGLLQSQRLITLLDSADVDLVFYIHYSLQKFAHLFQSNNPHIKIALFADYDVQQLLKESALLITDYSSVFFDFAYMYKPEIYYQFDYDDFYTKHYQKGYFEHARDGFGPVVTDLESLLNEIESNIKNNFVLDEIYKDRIDRFFPLHDDHNCERIYNAVIELQHERKAH